MGPEIQLLSGMVLAEMQVLDGMVLADFLGILAETALG